MNTTTLKDKRKQHLTFRKKKKDCRKKEAIGEIIELYTNNTVTEDLIIGCTSFWDFVNENYPLSGVFLPDYFPKNNKVTLDEVIELKNLITVRDHYSIKNMIKKRYV